MFSLETFYKSREWESLRAQLMQERTNENGELLCAVCGQPILKRYDCIAHHTIELNEENVNDLDVSLNPEKIQLIHFHCHNRIHERFGAYRKKVYLVYGSPCSGKSSFVDRNANPDDLILDVDRLWDAVCNAGRYNKHNGKSDRPNRLRANVFALRDCILDQIKTRTGNWRAAYVIGGYPLRTERDRLCMLLNADPIYIEATKEECMERCAAERPKEWAEYIEKWFDLYVP